MTTLDITEITLLEIKQAFGFVPNLFAAYIAHPALLEANWNKVKAVLIGGKVKRKTKEIIALLVSFDNECAYCVAAHTTALRSMKLEQVQLDALLQSGLFPSESNICDIALIKFARKVNLYWRDMKDTDINELKQLGISEPEILEIIGLVELFAGFNRFAKTMQIQIDF